MNVLLVKLSSLGDVVHALPVVQDLRAARRDVQIDWVVEPAFAPLLARVEGLHGVIDCAQRRWRKSFWSGKVRREWAAFKQKLKSREYDAVIDLQGLVKSAWIASLARGRSYGLANQTEGSSYEWPVRFLLDVKIPIEPKVHAVDRSRQLAARALGYKASGAPRYGLAGRAPKLPKRTVVFAHAASRADKLWPEARWVGLGRQFVERGWDVVLPHGSEDEQVHAERIAAAIDSKITAFGQATRHTGPVVQVWPRLKLDALVDRMGAASAVIGVDSGLSHIAVALDLPHVQIYNHPTAWRTGPSSQVRHQLAVGGSSVPSQEEVWAAWQKVATASGLAS